MIPNKKRRASHQELRRKRLVLSSARLSRRKFLYRSTAATIVSTLASARAGQPPHSAGRSVLFFNLARPQGFAQNASGEPVPYYLTVSGRQYLLGIVGKNQELLIHARSRNSFLQAVPNDQITHYVEDLVLADDITELGYVWAAVDETAGTWQMESVIQFLSASSMTKIWGQLRSASENELTPLSSKRDFYGLPAVFSQQDLSEELSLLDYTDTARTLISLHPDMLCANPDGAAYIATRYVGTNSNTTFLAHILRNAGPATPQEAVGAQNAQGWATLLPMMDDDGTLFKMENGLNQYYPDWSTSVDARVGLGLTALLPKIKDDTVLGSDITGFSARSSTRFTTENLSELSNKVWYRHDGVSAVNHGSNAFKESLPKWDYRQKNGETGLHVTQPTVEQGANGEIYVTLDNVDNWFLRFLGVYLQFVDASGKVIPKAQLPPYVIGSRDPTLAPALDRGDALYAGIVPPVFSVAGIPIYPPGTLSVVINMPVEAATVNVFYAGAGLSGSATGPDGLIEIGVGLTSAINFGLVSLFMAAGVSTISSTIKEVIPDAQFIAVQIVGLLGDILSNPRDALGHSFAILRGLLMAFAGRGLTSLLTLILKKLTAAQFINSIPVAGLIARAAAAAIGALQLATSLIEVAISPPVYEFDLTFTHDLSVDILPDPNRRSFPPVTNDEVLYYKVNYLFDNGSPHYLDHVDVADPNVSGILVTLKAIPWGGKVNISVGFYIRKTSTSPDENDWCVGKGTTGLVANTEDQAKAFSIEEFSIPITSNTVYIHASKTALNASGHHYWVTTGVAPAYVPLSSINQPGSIGALRSITVRQATQRQKGYLGYSWQSYSTDVFACDTTSRGQLDVAGNVNTSGGNGGADAQDGYAITSCGSPGGATGGIKLSYNLLTNPTANFYLDTSSLMLRQIQLDPVPSFTDPLSNKSFGKLNLDSTMLLLHPSGYAVSINNANSKLEALRLPETAVNDLTAEQKYLARSYSGQGTRPGLMKSPLAASVTAEGAILVLEDGSGNNRLQAFDLGGNPIQFFKNQADPYFLYLPATMASTYLDMAVEFSGYIYVLSRSGAMPVFRLDIYHPAQTGSQPIATTIGVHAGRLCVDFWRSIYTLNYEVLKLPSGQVPGLTEPSVSFWLPRSVERSKLR